MNQRIILFLCMLLLCLGLTLAVGNATEEKTVSMGPIFAIFGGFFIGIILFIIFLILLSIFWIWMIVDCAQRTFKQKETKTLWVVVLVLAGGIGAIIYYFMVKRKDTT